jgi:hypothetical protein
MPHPPSLRLPDTTLERLAVEAVAASPHAQLDDAGVLEPARAQQRAVVTDNVRDLRPMHVEAIQPGGAGSLRDHVPSRSLPSLEGG